MEEWVGESPEAEPPLLVVPYDGGVIALQPVPKGWEVRWRGRLRRARTVYEAVEAVVARPVGRDELRVIVAALEWQTRRAESRREGE
jgi:hypothetical protein